MADAPSDRFATEGLTFDDVLLVPAASDVLPNEVSTASFVTPGIEINVPIGCGDAPVFPGDVILGDSDGVIVIPAHLADEIADETVEMTAFEDFVTGEVRKGRSILGLYPATDPQTLVDFAEWRKKNGR